jgi:hypothetical protein
MRQRRRWLLVVLGTMAAIAGLIALLLFGIKAVEISRRIQSVSNLKQLSLALLSYEAHEGQFPARKSTDRFGNPLLSWRVHILPYIDEAPLYRQFHLDEPWDSEHNRTLIGKMPVVFQSPNVPRAPGSGETQYLAVFGQGIAFDGSRGQKLSDLIREPADTVLAVEVDADHAVVWTKPDDLPLDPKNPFAGLRRAHRGGFAVAFADGRVVWMSGQEVSGKAPVKAGKE